MDIRAAKTIFVAVLAFLVCYIPPLSVVAILPRVKPESNGRTLLGHFAYLAMLMSSGINPIIYCFRVRRFRRALKQLLNDPCGKTPFQDSDQKLRFKHNVPNQNATEMGLTVRRFGKQKKAGIEDEVCGLDGVPYLVRALSPQNDQSENIPQLTWVENHPRNCAGTCSGVESPAPEADYTSHVVTVEVHPVPYNKPLKQKVAKKPILRDDYPGNEHLVCIYSYPKDQLSKRKVRPENDMYVKNQTAQEFTAEESISLHKEKPTNHTISQHLPTSADCTDQLTEEINVEPKERPSDQKMIESPTVNTNSIV